MSLRIPPLYRTVLAALFAGALAPWGVRHFDVTGFPLPPYSSPDGARAPVQKPQTTRVRATGRGPTPEAAFLNALEEALRRAAAAEVSADDWQRYGRDYVASLRRDGTGVLRGWHEVSNGSEHRLVGRAFRSEVSVEVDVDALRERLSRAGPVTRR